MELLGGLHGQLQMLHEHPLNYCSLLLETRVKVGRKNIDIASAYMLIIILSQVRAAILLRSHHL